MNCLFQFQSQYDWSLDCSRSWYVSCHLCYEWIFPLNYWQWCIKLRMILIMVGATNGQRKIQVWFWVHISLGHALRRFRLDSLQNGMVEKWSQLSLWSWARQWQRWRHTRLICRFGQFMQIVLFSVWLVYVKILLTQDLWSLTSSFFIN